jgi:glycerol transport system ATP-binding protein
MDEPLVNLDYKLREELRIDLQEIFERREAIVVYTTTEPAEALMLGGNIVVIDEGRILHTGPTSDVYHNPTTTKVAEVFSDPPINYLTGSVQGAKAHLGERIEFPLIDHMQGLPPGQYAFGVRSNHLFLSRKSTEDTELRGKVELAEINGSETFIHVQYDNSRLVVIGSARKYQYLSAPAAFLFTTVTGSWWHPLPGRVLQIGLNRRP